MPTPLGLLTRRRIPVFGLIALGALMVNPPGGALLQAQAPSSSATPAPPAGAPAGFDFAGQREEIFKAFYTTDLDTSTAYTVNNLAIKKDNTFNEQYDIVQGDGFVRRGAGSYRSTCYPAAF